MTTTRIDQFGQMLHALSRALGFNLALGDIDAPRAVDFFESEERLQEGRASGGA